MDDHFYDNDFEKFLQQQVKHHRMYPSDAVWKGIHKQMHGYKKWPGLYFIAILMVASLTICTVFIDSEPIVYTHHSNVAVASSLVYDHFDPVQTTNRTLNNIQQQQNSTPFALHNGPADIPVNNENINTVSVDRSFTGTPAYIAGTTVNTALINTSTTIETPASNNTQSSGAEKLTEMNVTALQDNDALQNTSNEEMEATAVTPNNLLPTDEYLQQNPDEADRIKKQSLRTKPAKWQFQFYIAPSLSNREVVDEKPAPALFNGPVANNSGANASKVIRYHPGMGIEAGIGVLYGLTNKVRIKAALQYNARQYNIEAYSGTTELAKIALLRGNVVDTIQTISRYRSSGAYNEAQLLNKYHQVSLPVGIEYALLQSKRFGVNLAGSLQPTYTFSQSSYLLTADYKSYADGTSMLRRWNINSSLEATFSYKAGNIQWKFGPQLRYQHLPTYSDPYPVKEYLVDYGFKIGFTKTIQ